MGSPVLIPSVMRARLVSTLASMHLNTARTRQLRPLTMDTLNRKSSYGNKRGGQKTRLGGGGQRWGQTDRQTDILQFTKGASKLIVLW